jgi:2-amino-4-hydroxy-6-hydroxymethyldihydropteridine diphosphokinase
MSEIRWNRAYLSLGSNIKPEFHLPASVGMLSKVGRVLAVSQVWESAPFGYGESSNDQGTQNFLNAAVLLETLLSAQTLCVDAVPTLEARLGRVRDPHDKNAPRTIDVDLSLFNRDVLTIGHRSIPAPDILTRAFVAVPLAELDPDYIHPTADRTLARIAAELAPTFSMRLRPEVALR